MRACVLEPMESVHGITKAKRKIADGKTNAMETRYISKNERERDIFSTSSDTKTNDDTHN